MIAVDTSAQMAIVRGEREKHVCIEALSARPNVPISAITVAEALIVAGRPGVGPETSTLAPG
jgi:ribonuclease VapC